MVEKFADRSEGFNAVVTEVLTNDGGPRHEHIENHENQEDNKEAFADFEGDFFDEGRAEGVDNFDENEAEKAPESHDGEGGATSDAAELSRVVPGGGAGEGFLEKAEAVFDGATDEGGIDENLPVFEFLAEERPTHEGGAETIDDVEWSPDDAAVGHPDAGAGFEVGAGEDKEVFVDSAENGADEEDEEEFFEAEALSERASGLERFGGFGCWGVGFLRGFRFGWFRFLRNFRP